MTPGTGRGGLEMTEDLHLKTDQIEALAIILTALGRVRRDRRLGTLAVACRIYLDATCGRYDRPSFGQLIEAVGLDDS